MPSSPFTMSAAGIDLTSRVVWNTTVAASPTGSGETTIANLVLPSGIAVQSAVVLFASAAWTVGTNGVSVLLKIKRSTTVLGSTGPCTDIAANLNARSLFCIDTGSADAQAYTLTMTVASGSAGSTVSSVLVGAIIV